MKSRSVSTLHAGEFLGTTECDLESFAQYGLLQQQASLYALLLRPTHSWRGEILPDNTRRCSVDRIFKLHPSCHC